jgi:putative ABC transport system ATP-binding protein
MKDQEDNLLVEKAKHGESEAFDILVKKLWQWTYTYAYGFTRDVHVAQDIAQESLVKSWENLSQLDNPERFRQWLRKIVMNEALMYLRQKKDSLPIDEVSELMTDPSEMPDEEIIKRESIDIMSRAMHNLSVRQRFLLTLFYVDGLSQRDIGALLEVSEPTVKSRLHDARSKLRKEMEMMESVTKNREIVLKLNGIKYTPDDNKIPVLADIDLEVMEGELFAISGTQNCGKDEVLKIIGLLENPDSGSIEINGANVLDLDPFRFVEIKVGLLGYVWMEPQLSHHMSAFENIILPIAAAGVKRANCIEKGVESLRFVGLDNGKKEIQVKKLSFLDQQRIVLARAIISDPVIIIAQEPTGNMPVADGREFADILKRVTQERNITVVCTTHDLKLLQLSDRVAWMQDGRIVKIGTFDEGAPPRVGRGAYIYRYPNSFFEYLYYSGKYSGEKKELLGSAVENYDKAIKKAMVLCGKPENTDQELMELQISETNEVIELLESVVSNLKQVLRVGDE